MNEQSIVSVGISAKGSTNAVRKRGDDIHVAAACLDEREEAGAVNTLAAGEDGIEIVEVGDDEVKRLEPSVASGIHKINHADIVVFHKTDDVCFSEFRCRLLKICHYLIGIEC
jgi:hypothetical protein